MFMIFVWYIYIYIRPPHNSQWDFSFEAMSSIRPRSKSYIKAIFRHAYTYSTTRSTSTQPSVVVEFSHLAKMAVAGPQRRAQFSQAIQRR
jgi:acetyl-CoA carboxylase alpha subunit